MAENAFKGYKTLYKRWNSEEYEGLIPKFGGKPSKLTKENKEELKS